jgi:hypothetical protein
VFKVDIFLIIFNFHLAQFLGKLTPFGMLVKGTNYNPPTQYLFLDEKRKLKLVARVKKSKFGMTKEDLCFINN